MQATTWTGPREVAQLTIDQCSDAIIWHRGRIIVYVNEQACRSLGYSRAELEGMALDDIDSGTSLERKQQLMELMLEHGSTLFESMYLRKDGTTFPVEVRCTRHEVDGERLFCEIVRDITERRLVEQQLADSQRKLEQKIEELQLSENRYRSITEATSDAIVLSRDGKIHEVNESFADMFGISQSDAVGLVARDIMTPESAALALQNIASDCEERYCFDGLRSDGAHLDVEAVGRTIREHGQKVRISALRNISQRKRAERRLALAMEAGGLGTFELCLADGTMVVSDSFYRLFGLEPGCAPPTFDLFSAQVHPCERRSFPQCCDEARAATGPLRSEFRVFAADGSIRWLEKRAAVARDSEGSELRIDGAVFDITEKKQAEETLEQSQRSLATALEDRHRLSDQVAHLNRLSSVNQMASAMAHELNQPLAAITNNASILQFIVSRGDHTNEETLELAKTVGEQAVRAGEIVRRMRQFCFDKPSTRSDEYLAEVISETLDLLNGELRAAGIEVTSECSDVLLVVDRVQLQQVLVNLVQNAIQAMRSSTCESRQLKIEAEVSDGAVSIRVADSGPGVSGGAETLFEPFQSTKENGMGIGLAISRSIVENHNGKLDLESTSENGATFVIQLPLEETDQ